MNSTQNSSLQGPRELVHPRIVRHETSDQCTVAVISPRFRFISLLMTRGPPAAPFEITAQGCTKYCAKTQAFFRNISFVFLSSTFFSSLIYFILSSVVFSVFLFFSVVSSFRSFLFFLFSYIFCLLSYFLSFLISFSYFQSVLFFLYFYP